MKVCISQPTYLPWIGFFHKFIDIDVFSIYDTAQYFKRGFQNRNKIRNPNDWQWLTVPVNSTLGERMNEVRIVS